ncbi:hypothetical protein JCM8115_002265 [Rhodotorula mucilaginosa]|jgi:hypothetical protein
MQTTAGTVHVVSAHPPLTAFEFASSPARNAADPLLLFVAGLGDTLLSVPYLGQLAQAVDKLGWRCAQALLTSSGAGWGTATVAQDAVELAKIVGYYKEKGASKVVLLGHSTGKRPACLVSTCNRNLPPFFAGCQDAIAYLHLKRSRPDMPVLDGVILQAPVSDREAPGVPDVVERSVKPVYDDGKYDLDAFVPPAWAAALQTEIGITYRRFFSLVLPPESGRVDLRRREDFFSSDLEPEYLAEVFEPVDYPLLFALSGNDATYPEHVKLQLPALLERFETATPAPCRSRFSCIVPNASHDLDEPEPARVFVDKVTGFLQGL